GSWPFLNRLSRLITWRRASLTMYVRSVSPPRSRQYSSNATSSLSGRLIVSVLILGLTFGWIIGLTSSRGSEQAIGHGSVCRGGQCKCALVLRSGGGSCGGQRGNVSVRRRLRVRVHLPRETVGRSSGSGKVFSRSPPRVTHSLADAPPGPE